MDRGAPRHPRSRIRKPGDSSRRLTREERRIGTPWLGAFGLGRPLGSVSEDSSGSPFWRAVAALHLCAVHCCRGINGGRVKMSGGGIRITVLR